MRIRYPSGMATVDLADQSGAQLSLNTHFVFAVALSWRSHLPRPRPLLAGSGVGWLASTFRRFFRREAGRPRPIGSATGNSRAHIFCSKIEAELLAIDGLYKTADDIEADLRGWPIQAWPDGDTIRVVALD